MDVSTNIIDLEYLRNPIYSTGVGLLLYGLKQHQEGKGTDSIHEPQIQIVDKVKNWFQGHF